MVLGAFGHFEFAYLDLQDLVTLSKIGRELLPQIHPNPPGFTSPSHEFNPEECYDML